jgi:predicted enzyme related to lactoylglutathione lyase
MRIRGFAPATPCWVELASVEPAHAAEFYAGLFGWEPAGDRFKLGGRAAAGLTRARADRPAGWLTYLAENDLAAAIARVEAAGGRCLSGPAEGHGGRSAIIADASGATLGLWQHAGFTGAQVAGEPGTMTWPELLTDNPGAAIDFYARAFGWLLRDEYGSNGSRGEWLTSAHDAMAGLAPGGDVPRWRSAFQVADCHEAIARCRRLGGELFVGPLEMGFGSYAELVDPWGLRFAVAAPANMPAELSLSFSPLTGMELTFRG